MPSMQALRASGGSPLPAAYAPTVQHSPPPAAPPGFAAPLNASFTAAPAVLGAPAGVAPGSFSQTGSFAQTGSFSQNGSYAAPPSAGFGNGAFAPYPATNQGVAQPVHAAPAPQPGQQGGFPVRFDTPGAGLL